MSMPEYTELLFDLLRWEGLQKPGAALQQLVAGRAPRSGP
jgi:hypothetical protein